MQVKHVPSLFAPKQKCFGLFCTMISAFMLLLSGCGAGSGQQSLSSSMAQAEGYSEIALYDDVISEENGLIPEAAETVPVAGEKKIIRNGSMDLQADDVAEAYQKYLAEVSALGGYEFSKNFSTSNSYQYLNVTLKIPAEHLDTCMNIAADSDYFKIINSSVSADDVTSQYTDTSIRLQTKRATLEKYYDMLAQATTMEQIIMLQQEIDTLTADIESFEGMLKLWDSQVKESTLSLYIQQSSDPNHIVKDIDWKILNIETMGALIQNIFLRVSSGIITLIQWVIILIIGVSPILLVIAAVVILICLLVKRRKKAQKNRPPSSIPNPTVNSVSSSESEQETLPPQNQESPSNPDQ